MIRGLIVSALLWTFAGCARPDCVNEIRSELIAPGGIRKAVLFSRECGATVGSNTQVSVLGAKEQLPDDAGNVCVIDSGEAHVLWRTDGVLSVALDRGARVFKKEQLVHGIVIEYHDQ